MIARVFRRVLCRAGRHHVLRCAGAEDHAWTHDGDRWTATLDRIPPLAPAAPVTRTARPPARPRSHRA